MVVTPRLLETTLSLLIALPVVANGYERRELQGRRADEAPVIDGDLSDAVWSRAEVTGGFTQRYPDTGKPPSYPTEVRVLHDDEALYVAARCFDPEPDGIIARVTRRDRWIDSDWFEVHIDSRRDRRTGFFFAVNAAGVLCDGTFYDENRASAEWDGVWEAATRITGKGWQVEMRIPLRLLRFRAGPDVRFGVNFERWVSRLNEQVQWQFIHPDSGLYVSRFGDLAGLALPDQPLRAEVVPYLAARPAVDDAGAEETRRFDLGADARLGLGSSFNLTLTANPDFGQVEVDQVVLNLSTIETYYPEKRPFFLEDKSLFAMPGIGGDTNAALFYTRRIGRAPRTPPLGNDEELLRGAYLPRIYAAAKLAGRTEGRLSLGVLQAVTSCEEALVRRADGEEARRVAEPLTSFSILRLAQDFRHHSSAGLMATALATPQDGAAVTGGADLQMEMFGDAYKLSALALFSYLTEERYGWQDQYIEAALRREGGFGYGGHLRFEKQAGEHLLGSIDGFYYGPNLALNDLGYLDRADRWMVSARLVHRRNKPWGPVSRYFLSAMGWVDRSSRGVNLGDGFMLDSLVAFSNDWSASGWFFCGWPLCDDRETRTGGEVVYCGSAQRYRVGLSAATSSKYPVTGGVDWSWRTTEHGQATSIHPSIQLHPHPRLQLEIMPGYSYSRGAVRWIDTRQAAGGERFLFADQHAEYWDVTLRGTFTFTTELTLQAFAQLFLASVDHTTKYGHVPGDEDIHLGDLVVAGDVDDDYDFTSANLNLSVVLRWEYLPGSIAYLVYTGAFGAARELPEFRFGRVLETLVDDHARHVLMLKVSCFWG